MKKIALLLAMLAVTQASFAYLEEYTTSDNKTLQGTGYSQDTLKIIDAARVFNQGAEKDYVPFYGREYYSKNPIRKWYQVAKRYFDPASDERVFGVREIHYENGMFDLSPSYSARFSPNDRYNRLFKKDLDRLDSAGKVIKGSGGYENEQDRIDRFNTDGYPLENL